jgi:hypothetical protein
VIVAGLVALPMPAHSLDDVLGWEGTAWGMTESEVTKKMASRGFKPVVASSRVGDAIEGEIPLQTKVVIDGNTYDAALRFVDRGLTAVLISTVTDSADRAVALHDGVLRSLTARYGASSITESRGTSSLIRWTFKTTTIALRREAVVDVRGRPRRQVSIVYTPATQSDEREPDEGILFLLLLQMLGKGRR